MANFIIKRRAASRYADLDAVAALPGIRVLDRVANQALLVETDEWALDRHRDALSAWTVAPETTLPPPM